MNEFNTARNLVDLIKDFVSEHDSKPGTLKIYKFLLWKFFIFMKIKGYNQRSPGEKHLLWFKRELLETGKSPAYVNLCLTAVKTFFRWMEANKYYTAIGATVKAVERDPNFKKVPLFKEDVKKILQGIDDSTLTGSRDKALITLLFSNGLRIGEAVGLTIGDFDPDKGLIYITGKGRFEREPVNVSPGVTRLINNYLDLRKNWHDELKPDSPLFISHKEKFCLNAHKNRITPHTATGIINSRLIKAGIKRPGVSAHSLRHGSGVELILSGSTLYEVSIFLRHRSLNVSRLYTKYSERILMNKKGPESTLFNMLQD
jgi:integrase/recombinase XerD